MKRRKGSQRRRASLWRATGPAVLALALSLSACGGSAVEGPTSALGDPGVVTSTDAEDAAAGEAPEGSGAVEPGIDAPGNTTAGEAPGSVDAKPGQTGVTGGQKPSTGKSGSGAGGSGGGQASNGPAAGVERAIANLPIFGGSQACKPATLSEVLIGNVSTNSGVLGELFEPAKVAMETFVASQNACGGLNGHKIKYLVEDDQGDPATAATKVQKLIDKKILAFVGNVQVLTVDGIVPTIKKAGMPVIGSDLTNDTWFTNPLFFPQGSSVQSMGYGALVGVKDYHKVTTMGSLYCIEVPRACQQWNQSLVELAPQMGIQMKRSVQGSLTQPSYVQQCLDLKNAGVEAVAIGMDAASQVRFARSCTQVGFHPKIVTHPVSLGNEQQFLGNEWLGNTWVPVNTFPWRGDTTGPEKYYQAAVKKYNPGAPQGGSASLAWAAGAMLVAAAANLPAENPTTQNLLDALYSFQGQKFTELGGISGPKTFRPDGNPKLPYCYFAQVTNDKNDGWNKVISSITCSKVVAPSDPLARG